MTTILPPQPQKELKPLALPNLPWVNIGVDLICDLPTNEYGLKHALAVTFYLSKFTAARPFVTKSTKEVLRKLENIYYTLGVPKIMQHDQGPEFRRQVMYLNLECRYIRFLRLNRVCTNEVLLRMVNNRTNIFVLCFRTRKFL